MFVGQYSNSGMNLLLILSISDSKAKQELFHSLQFSQTRIFIVSIPEHWYSAASQSCRFIVFLVGSGFVVNYPTDSKNTFCDQEYYSSDIFGA
jgi:hypothetical protein